MSCGPFQVGQGAHNADCGYFAAYVLMLHSHPGGFRAGMTRDDVIAERDAFRQSRGLASGNYFLTTTNLVAFLRELGLPGYTAIQYRATPRFPDTLHETQEMIFHEAPM